MIVTIAIIMGTSLIIAFSIMAVYSIKDFYEDRKEGNI